ncbi:Ref family recombination enhancement nuclease [Stenotrophomonas sp. GD04145]|uniref:Ref family recombination enhancement nuclease n=1 Tax=Stenotrophomonas sp. GD04145 TaxID=2975436 RepID=UPI00244AC831|nr:Ref family recombination enhancement nuclease [Stenotrophomonas sp. GD04145]MDH0171368.1 Ref family recombination enhancement nuclease [Stenotrophomonas sp. GD04145]
MWSNAPPPTKEEGTREEGARIELAKTGPCMACLSLQMQQLLEPELVIYGCDYNHVKSGSRWRGHMFGYALCKWHNMRYLMEGNTFATMRQIYGPSLLDGSPTFHETYGSDDELIANQTYIDELRAVA